MNVWEVYESERDEHTKASMKPLLECLFSLYLKAGLTFPEEFDPQHEAERIARALEL